MPHPLRDAVNGGIKEFGDACYKAGFRDGVMCTVLVFILIGLFALWYRGGKKQ